MTGEPVFERGRQAVKVGTEAAAAAPAGPTPETFGVSQAQFDKFYSKDNQVYNWEAHAKEQAWQLQNKGQTPAATPPAGDQPATQPATPDPAQAPQAPATLELTPADQAVTDAANAAGVDWQAAAQHIAEHGKVSPEDKAKLIASGVAEHIIDEYATFKFNEGQVHVSTVMSHIGGEQGYAALKEWAVANLNPEERRQYEVGMADPKAWRSWADSLLSRAGRPSGAPQAKVPLAGPNAQAAAAPTSAQAFPNEAAFNAAQRDKRYKSDPAFRAEVYARLAASKF